MANEDKPEEKPIEEEAKTSCPVPAMTEEELERELKSMIARVEELRRFNKEAIWEPAAATYGCPVVLGPNSKPLGAMGPVENQPEKDEK
ncbi:MAG: hypothetical protein J6P83_02450 [Bacteroidales bacterium]|nr:hypothetical protein [Bacteroidales bacterium]